MKDPVFVDTSEGRADVADSLRPKLDDVATTTKPVTKDPVVQNTKKKDKKNKNKDSDDEEDAASDVELKEGWCLIQKIVINKKLIRHTLIFP